MNLIQNIKRFFRGHGEQGWMRILPSRYFSRRAGSGSVEATEVQNLYMAARPSEKRNKLLIHVQDSRWDLTPEVRTVLIGKSRYFSENNPFVGKILDVIDSYVNGANGLSVVPSNGKDRVDNIASRCWNEWKDDCDFLGRHKFSFLTSLILRLMLVDGECFIVLRECPGQKAQHQIHVLETHRCVSPAGVNNNIIDGIKYDAYGRPVSYYLSDGMDCAGTPKEFSAEDVIHCFIPTRPGQLRGIPYGTSALTTLQDFEMVEGAEVDALKDNARKIAIVETPEGEVSDDIIQEKLARGEDLALEGNDVLQHPLDEKSHRLLEDDYGGYVLFVKQGTKWNQNPAVRPSQTIQNFWEYEIEKVCIAFNVSKILIFPQSLQGTTARADIAATESTFKMLFSALEDIVLKLYRFAISGYSSKFAASNDFLNAKVVPPKVLTADIARESSATMAELSAGITTLQDVCGADGKDWREILRKRAETVAYWQSVCAEHDITDDTMKRLVYNPVQNIPAPTAPKTPEPDPVKPKKVNE